MWVQLDDRQQREDYLSFLNAYTNEQKKLGRFQRPTNNLVLPVMEYLDQEEVVPEEATALLIISILFLLVCSVNLIGLVGDIRQGLDLINRLFDNNFSFHLDVNMVVAALVLSLAAGMVAGIYPAWRICRVPPANYLKLQ